MTDEFDEDEFDRAARECDALLHRSQCAAAGPEPLVYKTTETPIDAAQEWQDYEDGLVDDVAQVVGEMGREIDALRARVELLEKNAKDGLLEAQRQATAASNKMVRAANRIEKLLSERSDSTAANVRRLHG
jgi:hypothetical protein